MTPKDRLKAIEKAVTRNPPGKNEGALRDVYEHVRHLESVFNNAYAEEKLKQIIAHANIYFSVRRHTQYGGGQQVASWILTECSVLEGLLPNQ